MKSTARQRSAQPGWLGTGTRGRVRSGIMHRSRIGARVAPALLLVVGVIVGPSASTSLALDPLGTISTVAGGGNSLGDGGPATSAGLGYLPRGVAVDAAGNVYIADTGNNRVRKVGTDGTITTIAGTGVNGFSGDGGPATSAQLNGPQGVAVDPAGNLYIADTFNSRIRKVLLAAPPSGLVPLASRLFDTRPGTAAGAIAVPKQLVAGGSFLEVQLTGNAGIPGSGVGSVVLNVTAVDPTADGFVTVYPCGTRPATSNLNYTSGRTVANTVITPVSGAGKVCFYAHGTTHLIADLSGWFPT